MLCYATLRYEVNGTSSGLHPDFADEDNGHIRDLVVAKMDAVLCAAREADDASAA